MLNQPMVAPSEETADPGRSAEVTGTGTGDVMMASCGNGPVTARQRYLSS
jgi:hypothetical protein